MENIAFKYIFKKLVRSFLAIAPIIILLVWLTISIRFISFIVTDDISITTFFRLISCHLPSIASSIIPICALISSITVFYSMQSNKEIMVLMTSGKSKFSIAKPLFVFSIIISSLTLALLTCVSPYSQKHSLNLQQKIQSQISMSIVKPGVFNVIGDSVIYIREKTNDSLRDVFISYIPKNKHNHTNIITAKKGRYLVSRDRLLINFDQGYRQELDENNNAISTLKFESFSYDVTEFIKRYARKVEKPYEKTQGELLAELKRTNDSKLKQKYIAEYHSRLVLPFIPLLNAIIISIFLMHSYIRSKKALQVSKAFIFGIICQISVMTLTSAAIKHTFLIYANYVLLIASVMILLVVSFGRKSF